MSKVFFLGDSITHGAWDTAGGWATRLANEIHTGTMRSNFKKWSMAYNLGLGGDTSAGLAARVGDEVRRRIGTETVLVCVVAIGINDIGVVNKGGNSMDAVLARYAVNLTAITAEITVLGGATLFVGLTPIDEDAVDPCDGRRAGDDRSNSDIRAMNQRLADFCREHGHRLIPVYDDVMSAGLDRVLADGLHPNPAGHELIAAAVRGPLFGLLDSAG